MDEYEKILLIPMAGYGKRFVEAGYSLPKQFLRLNNSCCLKESLDSLDLDYFDKIIVGCREEFERAYNLCAFLKESYPTSNFSMVSFYQLQKVSIVKEYL